MKNIFLILSFFLLTTTAFAQNSENKSQEIMSNLPKFSNNQVLEALEKTPPLRWLPNHRLYFLITAKEQVQRFLQPSIDKRVEWDIILALKRAKEIYKLTEKGKIKYVQRGLDRYESKIDHILSGLNKTKSQGKDIALIITSLAESLEKQQILIAKTLEKTPKEERKNLVNSFEKAQKGLKKAIDKIVEEKPEFKERLQKLISDEG